MKTNEVKKGLVASGLSLLMMMTVMAGTSFAWFNQTIVNQGARIQAGTLQVEFLADADGDFSSGSINLATASDPVFQFGTNAQPGDTQSKYLRVKNLGTISLDYEVMFRVVLDTGLGEAVVITIDKVTPDEAVVTRYGDDIAGYKLQHTGAGMPEDEFETYLVTMTFDESAGNEFQGTAFELDITLIAWQSAQVASKPIVVSSIGELQAAQTSAVKGSTIVVVENITANSTSIAFTELINLDLRGNTLSLQSFSVTSTDYGFMRFEDGQLTLTTFTINAPNATLTHASNLTITVSGTTNVTVSNNTYNLDGTLQSVTLSALSNSRLSISSGATLTATTLTVGGTASIILTGTLTATTLNIALTATVIPQAASILNATTVTGGAQILPVEGATLNVPAFTIPVPILSSRIKEAFTKVSQVDLSKQEGQGTFTFNYELDGDGKITGEAKTSLDAQVPGVGGFVGFGYHEILAERPNSNVTHYAVEGLISFTHVNTTQLWPQGTTAVTTTPSGVGSRWYVYVARGYTSGTGADGWIPFGQNYIYTFTIKWYEGIGNLVSSEKLVVNFVNNSTQA